VLISLHAVVFAQGKATIKGKIIYDGTPPAPRKINPSEKKCKAHLKGKPIAAEELVVNSGNKGIKWAFIYVKSGLKSNPPAPNKPAVIDQVGCVYSPHVFGIVTGQTLEIRNSDPLGHNIHCLAKKNPQFNIGQPKKGMKENKKFNVEEVMVKFKCDIHSWMSSYCGVLKHPFYSVSGDDGSFAIKDLPPGTYTIALWHEKLGTQTKSVTVKAGETKDLGNVMMKK
jgi:plastocyanin